MDFADCYDSVLDDGKVLRAVPDGGVEAEVVGSRPPRLGPRCVPINLSNSRDGPQLPMIAPKNSTGRMQAAPIEAGLDEPVILALIERSACPSPFRFEPFRQ